MKASFLGLMIVAISISSAARQPRGEISLGQKIYPMPSVVGEGWAIWSVADVTRRIRADGVITETGECCTSLLFRGRDYLIARTSPVSSDEQGLGRIVEIHKVGLLHADEELMECSLLWIEPAASFVNQKTNEVRSFVATSDGIRQIKWTYEGDACFFEDRD